MKVGFKVLSYFFIAVTLQNCSTASNDTNENTEEPKLYYQELNIPYGDENRQKFDLYLPANRTLNTKTIILIHGGGWVSGDKSDMNTIKDLIRSDFPNLAIANLNYRYANSENKPYPMQTNDITSVITYLKSNAEKYTISNNFGFIGVSAGAHLSLLWSYALDTDKSINMVCSIVGPTNLTDPAYLNNTSPELQALLNMFGETPDIAYLEEASPLHQLTASAPPSILFYGGQDPLIPTTQGTDLRDKLAALNVTHQFTLYPNEAHGWEGLALLDTWTKLKAFIQTHLN
ncbi:lipase [Tamlana nanhaiensis]|uniref:Lipase n=1 Tax=Neotamlana nanhaiensis TaxID=1382798 RepID=A0A0D7W591_9FLAO|nr:alpha/beta hydrolase [Tamlana nanhaiensis]KJD32992.1 lipase [Tamlana nanhaiensis]